jgi:hypothetical protein
MAPGHGNGASRPQSSTGPKNRMQPTRIQPTRAAKRKTAERVQPCKKKAPTPAPIQTQFTESANSNPETEGGYAPAAYDWGQPLSHNWNPAQDQAERSSLSLSSTRNAQPQPQGPPLQPQIQTRSLSSPATASTPAPDEDVQPRRTRAGNAVRRRGEMSRRAAIAGYATEAKCGD